MKAMAKGLTRTMLAMVAATGAAFVPAGGGDGAAQRAASTLTFTSTQSTETQSPQTATGGEGSIDFTGSVTTGTPCYTVTGAHTDRRGNVTVTVRAESTGAPCTQIITNNNYTGRVSGLAAGTYQFTVVHRVGNQSETAFTGTVTVQ